MANKKITSLTDVVTLAAGDLFAINDVSAAGVNTFATATEVKTFIWTAPVFAAGTSSANTWPKFTSGTLLTTAEDGAIEVDTNCIYGCTDAGNRGVIPLKHYIRADATNTLTSTTARQKLFASPTNGTLTLETGVYFFNCLFRLSSMSSTNGNCSVSPKGGGTATTGKCLSHYWGWDNNGTTANRTVAGSFTVTASTLSSAPVVTANTATVLELSGRGSFEVSGAGTIIPSITLLTAAPAVLGIGSYFEIYRVGATGVVSVGQWS